MSDSIVNAPRALAVACLGAALLGACIDDELPTSARVLVESDPAAPLELVVSSNFLLRRNETTDQREAVPLEADTIAVSGDFDRVFDIARHARIYVVLRNDAATPESVRLRVLVDGSEAYDESDVIADGAFLDFLFTSRSAF